MVNAVDLQCLEVHRPNCFDLVVHWLADAVGFELKILLDRNNCCSSTPQSVTELDV